MARKQGVLDGKQGQHTPKVGVEAHSEVTLVAALSLYPHACFSGDWRAGCGRVEVSDGNVWEPTVGLEPTTCGLQNRCSAIELRRRRGSARIRTGLRGTRSIAAALHCCQAAGKGGQRPTLCRYAAMPLCRYAAARSLSVPGVCGSNSAAAAAVRRPLADIHGGAGVTGAHRHAPRTHAHGASHAQAAIAAVRAGHHLD